MSKIDQHLGMRVTQARELARLSVETVAAALELPVSDYDALESGQRRIGAFELAVLSVELRQTISWFYDGLPGQSAFAPKSKSSSV